MVPKAQRETTQEDERGRELIDEVSLLSGLSYRRSESAETSDLMTLSADEWKHSVDPNDLGSRLGRRRWSGFRGTTGGGMPTRPTETAKKTPAHEVNHTRESLSDCGQGCN